MFDTFEDLKCEKCGFISNQNTTSGVVYEDDKGMFNMYFLAQCPNCNNRFNSERAKKAKKVGSFM